MESDKAFSLALENQKISLLEEKEFLKKHIQKDLLEQQILKQKLFYWNSATDQLKIAAHLSRQQLADTLYQRKVTVKKKQVELEMEQTIMNTSLTQAEEMLREFFSNEHEGNRYIAQFIEQSFIKKGS
jgi:hypothetical protein